MITCIHLDEIPPHSDIIGAGVMPFCLKDDQIMFMLGQEDFVCNWKGSQKWSAFEGTPLNKREQPEVTAAREFFEESMGVFEESMDTIIWRLRHVNPLIILSPRTNQASERVPQYHITFMLQCDWNINTSLTFSRHKGVLEYLVWICLEMSDLKRCIGSLNLIQEGDLINGSWLIEIVEICRYESSKTSCQVIMSDLDEVGKVGSYLDTIIDYRIHSHRDLYQKWLCQRNCLREIFADNPWLTTHPAVELKVNALGNIVFCNINEAFIEKKSIRWWHADRLSDLLGSNIAYAQTIPLKSTFVPTLKYALTLRKELQDSFTFKNTDCCSTSMTYPPD